MIMDIHPAFRIAGAEITQGHRIFQLKIVLPHECFKCLHREITGETF